MILVLCHLLFLGCAASRFEQDQSRESSIKALYRSGFFADIFQKWAENKVGPQDIIFVARAYNELSFFDSAYSVSERALNVFSTDDESIQAQGLLLQFSIEHAFATIGLRHFDEALAEINRAKSNIKETTDLETRALVFRLESRFFFERGDIRTAQNLVEDGLEVLQSRNGWNSAHLSYPFTSSLLLMDLAKIMFFLDNIEKTHGILIRCLQIFEWNNESPKNVRLSQCLIAIYKNVIRGIEVERTGSYTLFQSDANPNFDLAYKVQADLERCLTGLDPSLGTSLKVDATVAEIALELNKESQSGRAIRRTLAASVQDFSTGDIDSLIIKLDSLESLLNPTEPSNLRLYQDITYLKRICLVSINKIEEAVAVSRQNLQRSLQYQKDIHPHLIRPLYNLCYALLLEFDAKLDIKIRNELDSLARSNIAMCKELLTAYKIGATPVDMLSISTSYIREPFSLYILIDADSIDREYSTVSFFKNYSKRWEAFIHKAAKLGKDSVISSLYEELNMLSTKESDLIYKTWSYSSLGESGDQIYLQKASVRKDRVWRELSTRCLTSAENNPPEIDTKDLVSKLQNDEAIIDFLSMTMSDGSDAYFGYILSKEYGIRKQELSGSMTTVADDVEIYRKLIEDTTKIESDADEEYIRLCDYISGDLWYPLSKYISKDVNKLCIIPDGILSGFPFSTLRQGGRYLIDRYTITYRTHIGNEKHHTSVMQPRTNIFVAGGLNYGKAYFSLRYVNSFTQLSGSKREAKNLADALESNVPSLNVYHTAGDTLTESYFKSHAKDFDLIHISTHGFVAEVDQYSKLLDRTWGWEGTRVYPPLLFLGSLHPSIRCGLALSYCNKRSDKDGSWVDRGTKNNGLLMASEISFLNLSRSRLVVLSACNSNFGEYFAGEGIVSLTGSFLFAGAKDIVSTLFKIDDRSASIFMKIFYQRYLELLNSNVEVDIGRVLREAMLETRNFALGDQRLFSSPRHWVPFVAYSN